MQARFKALIGAMLCFALGAAVRAQGEEFAATLPDQVKWTSNAPHPAPEFSVLAGPIDKATQYTLRVRLKPGGVVRPHTHPDTRHITVLSGTLHVGNTDTVDVTKAKTYPTGTFFVVPAGVVHYSIAMDGEVVYQESGIGPSATNFVKN